MNKTITSNIAGYVFHIDENAFDKLDAYLNTIRSYFKDSQGKDEIISDIEARLAEMLHERIGDMKKVVTMEDVNHVILIMGQPEAFIDDDPENAAWTEQKSERRSSSAPKRLFRDADNRVVGGVCSGVSAYLGIEDPLWLRLALVISFFAFGSGFLLYLILWIIIPQAKTTAEKLQMRGENVTVSNIEKRVNEEMEAVKGKWNQFHGNSGPAQRVANGFHRVLNLILNLLSMFIKFIAKFIGFAFVLAGVLGLLSILSIPFGLPTMISMGSEGTVSSVDVQDIIHNLVGGTQMFTWITIAGLLVCGIPLLSLTFLGIKLLFNFKAHTKGIALSLLGLWIIGVIMSFTLTTIVVSDFSSEGSKTETVELELNSDPSKVIHLALNHDLGEDEPNVEAEIFNLTLLTTGNSTNLYGKPVFDITMAKTGGPKLIIKRAARAKKKQDAVERANKIEYGFDANDTSLLLNGFFAIPEGELWRTQEVNLELQLPVGYTIFISDDLKQIIYDIDNVTNTYDSDMVGRRWIMTPKGLACVDCDGLLHADETSFEDDKDQNDEIHMMRQRQLELEQKALEQEMDLRKKELERVKKELEKEQDKIDNEEANDEPDDSDEILLKRVVNAKYWITPSIYRTVSMTYPG
jgi:phage shock protein PspC (stress-responsive transcriptional regulator)